MKQYVVEPKMKKSIMEERTFTKKDGETRFFLTNQVFWRGGSFTIDVPETEEEIHAWLEERGWTQEDWDEGCVDESSFLPDEDDESIELDDYAYEIIDTWDGVSEEWELTCYPLDAVDEETLEEMRDAAVEVYSEDYEEGLFEDGWEEAGFCTYIFNGVTIREPTEGEAYD